MIFCGSHSLKYLLILNLKLFNTLFLKFCSHNLQLMLNHNLRMSLKYRIKFLSSSLLQQSVWLIWANTKLCWWNGLTIKLVNLRWSTEEVTIHSLGIHGMIYVLTKEPHSLSLRQRTGVYLEDSHILVGLSRMVNMEILMIKPGYFHLTIKPSSKLNNMPKGRRFGSALGTYVHLEMDMI